MTETNASPSPASPASPEAGGDAAIQAGETFESRLHAVQEALRGGASLPETADEASPVAPPSDASPAVSDDAAARAQARKERLAALAAKERQHVDSRARLAEADRLQRELAAERQRAAELEKRATTYVDPTKLDEATFFSLAEKANIAPAKLGEWLREAMANPERVAASSARKAIDPELEAIRRENAEMRGQLQSFIKAQADAQAQAEEAHYERQLVSSIQPGVAPHAHTFLAKFGPEEFLKVARSAGRTLPEGVGAQALIDTIEEHLEQFASAFVPAQPVSKAPASPSPVRAAAKANTTVSNAMAQQRASVVDEDDFADLSYDERLARLKRIA